MKDSIYNKIRSRVLGDDTPLGTMVPELAEIVVRDARKSLAVLEGIMAKDGLFNDDDLRMCVIHMHGMKSVLAGAGNYSLSVAALKLEQSARDGNVVVLASEAPAFLGLLRAFVENLVPKDSDAPDCADDDSAYLRESLLAIKTACGEYDERSAEKSLTELRRKAWSKPVKEMLSTLSEHLLHSDFDEVTQTVDRYLAV